MDRVRTPTVREVRKERAILTDAEFHAFIASPVVDLELRMLSLVARCEGGMRAGDLNRWDWTQIDRVHFAECIVPRAKTRTPQALAIPAALAPFLQASGGSARASRRAGPCSPCDKAPASAGSARAAEALPRACAANCSARGSPVRDADDGDAHDPRGGAPDLAACAV